MAQPERKASGFSSGSGDDLADRLHSAAIHLLRLLRKQDDLTGLTAPRLSALSVVVFAGPLTMGQLAKAEQVRAPTMTRLVQALERDGLLRRSSHPSDGRARLLEATARGRSVMREGRRRRLAALESQLEKLTSRERDQLREAVDVLERMLDD